MIGFCSIVFMLFGRDGRFRARVSSFRVFCRVIFIFVFFVCFSMFRCCVMFLLFSNSICYVGESVLSVLLCVFVFVSVLMLCVEKCNLFSLSFYGLCVVFDVF